MKKLSFLSIATAVVVCSAAVSQAATVTIEALDLRGTGVFGHADATLNSGPGNTTADPLDWDITYNNLDLDGDSTANDTVNFTVRASGGAGQRAWGQGVDTGFGSLNGVTFSVINVSGTTTDGGNAIVFDGFTGGAIGVGGNGDLDRNAEINGQLASVMSPSTGGFQFVIDAVDFAPTATVLYDNSGGTFGAVSARHHDLQFSAVPEPTALILFGLGTLGLAASRRR
ncbi:MAG: PEP-CTERM sorting domain-containing protein [Lacipirellulaceae bacterium]